jgi:hypothetical protein
MVHIDMMIKTFRKRRGIWLGEVVPCFTLALGMLLHGAVRAGNFDVVVDKRVEDVIALERQSTVNQFVCLSLAAAM